MELREALTQVQAVLQPQIADFFTQYRQRATAIDTLSEEVLDRLAEYCLRPGKAVRPLLVATGAALAQEIPLEEAWQQPAVKQAMLMVQLKHKRILMIDDISDQDTLRNGLPAFHVGWEQDLQAHANYQRLSASKRTHLARSFTEVAGMWLDSQTFWLLTSPVFTDKHRLALLEIMQEHVYDKTSAGWYVIFDQSFEELGVQTSEERLLRGLELVSGEYTFINPLRVGAMLGNLSSQVTPDLDVIIRQYGQAAGILFQITDDIIGAFGDPAVTGKPVGGDFREGKKTLLVQHAYRQANDQDKEFLRQAIGQENLTESDIKRVQAIMTTTNSLAYARQRAQEYATQASTALAPLSESAEKALLISLVEYVVTREK